MDSKRRNPSTSSITHHPKSAEHQPVHVKRSKTKVVTNPSEVSLTPSKLAEQEKSMGRKNPLDALSKVNVRQQMTERRSGLQEVDEEYLKQNVFRKTQFQRNSGLGNANSCHQTISTSVHAAGQPSTPHNETYPPNFDSNQQQYQQASTQQQQQQINQQPANAVSIPGDNQGNVNQSPLPTSQQHQQQISSTQQVAANAQMQYHQQQHHQQQHHSTHLHQTPLAMSPTPFNTSSMPEPEMCTTCPNCQTTIYLVPAQTTSQNQQTIHEASSSAANPANAQSDSQVARGSN